MLVATLCVAIPTYNTLPLHPLTNNENDAKNPCPQKSTNKVFKNIVYVDVTCDKSKPLPAAYSGFECISLPSHLIHEQSGEVREYSSGCELRCIDDCNELQGVSPVQVYSNRDTRPHDFVHRNKFRMVIATLGIVVFIIFIIVCIYIKLFSKHQNQIVSKPMISLQAYQV